MKKRAIASKLLELAAELPVVTIIGPRQSGKTTLCRMLFADKPYVNLEAPDERSFTRDDPRGFLAQFPQGAVLDEVQRVPELLSYIQVVVDETNTPGQFILTGSQNLLLMDSISQSLAGRTALATLYPFTIAEAYGKNPPGWLETAVRGFYPRVISSTLPPHEQLAFYITTYMEKDVRDLLNIKDHVRFDTFLKLCAGRTGQIINYSNLAADAGIAVNTAKDWLSVLEASFVVRRLPPWFANINKQLSKTPKLYFIDVGLACTLLRITTPEVLLTHPLRGPIFETLVVAEKWKRVANSVAPDNLYYYRDSTKTEIDLVEDTGNGLALTEIKSGTTIASDWHNSLNTLARLLPNVISTRIIYGGDKSTHRQNTAIIPWNNF